MRARSPEKKSPEWAGSKEIMARTEINEKKKNTIKRKSCKPVLDRKEVLRRAEEQAAADRLRRVLRQDRFLIKPRTFWVNSETGEMVSIYGAGAYNVIDSEAEKSKWSIQQVGGYRIFDTVDMTTRGRVSGFETVEDAEEWIKKERNRLEGYREELNRLEARLENYKN